MTVKNKYIKQKKSQHRQEIIQGIKRWMPIDRASTAHQLSSKRLEWQRVIDPKMIQALYPWRLYSAPLSIAESHPYTYEAILEIGESICQGDFGTVLEELARNEQEVLFSDRILFILLGYYQAKHLDVKLELFSAFLVNQSFEQWIAHLTPLSAAAFSDLLFLSSKQTSDSDQQWHRLTLTLFHLTEMQRHLWAQLRHIHNHAVRCFIYPSSSTVKLLLSHRTHPESWRKAIPWAISLKTPREQFKSWLEISKFLEIQGYETTLLELLEVAPNIGRELLIQAWLNAQLKKTHPIVLEEPDWLRLKHVMKTLSSPADAHMRRLAVLIFTHQRDYKRAKELIEGLSKKEQELLQSAMIEASAKQGDVAMAEELLNDLTEHEERQEAINSLLEILIRSDRIIDASRLTERLPSRRERQEAARAISSTLKRWQRQRRMLRSSMLRSVPLF